MVKKILILAANPRGDLKLPQEIRDIREGLRRSANREQFALETRGAVRVEDLTSALLEVKPWIVHFCGHGSGSEGLVLEKDGGQQHLVSTEALANLFRHLANRIECVLLNACYSEVQGQEIVKHINYVIGMRQEILDDTARAFTRGFYQALGNGESINFAYEWGCDRIQLEINRSTATRKATVVRATEPIKVPEHLIPILLKKEHITPIKSEEDLPVKEQQKKTASEQPSGGIHFGDSTTVHGDVFTGNKYVRSDDEE
ncbi:CHAT domain-containing protein [Calothrix rhizosoleniae]|uniref:CHAT domain-containing protein n=1 Tax=Calothrix rhizosoleniae TaxID=888997 RepID=UPI000B498C79|nr:CHAT domain-containing protein [Calothrix rhizosoleniae]